MLPAIIQEWVDNLQNKRLDVYSKDRYYDRLKAVVDELSRILREYDKSHKHELKKAEAIDERKRNRKRR